MRKGLTMIEMVVVIGIIGVLMAVLLGTFSGSTESARSAKCLANMHTLAVAVQGYAMEKGTYPYAGTVTKTEDGVKVVDGQGWIGWPTASSTDAGGSYCSPYEPNRDKRRYSLTNGVLFASMHGAVDAFVCPSHRRVARNAKGLTEPMWSYAMNASFGWDDGETSEPISQQWIARSDRKLLFAELPFASLKSENNSSVQTVKLTATASQENDPVLQYDGTEGGGKEMIGFNHTSGRSVVGHVCFCDGHVDKLRVPPSGLSDSDKRELTKWLCVPSDSEGEFDISFDGKRYKKIR